MDLSLTTPIVDDNTSVFPGENFFFYWKTSPSLWESKLAEQFVGDLIFVPINWSLHTEDGENYDFAKNRPETNLAKLSEIAVKLGKEILFLIPLTPLPFLPNGGVPHLLARTASVDEHGVMHSYIDQDGRVNKLHSFFDPRLYRAYQKFVWEVGQYFNETGVNFDIAGMIGGYTENGRFIDYTDDYSRAFEQGHQKFLSIKYKNKSINDLSKDEFTKSRNEYKKEVSNLYLSTSKECLNSNWVGTLKYSFIGGEPLQTIFRSFHKLEQSAQYFSDLMSVATQDAIPSCLLLNNDVKKGVMGRFVEDLVNRAYISSKLRHDIYDDANSFYFKPLFFFEIYQGNEPKSDSQSTLVNYWQRSGLVAFLQRGYKWTYSLKEEIPENFSYDEMMGKVVFFLGREIDDQLLKHIFKLFMSGAKVFLTKDDMNPEIKQRFDLFLLENAIQTEKLKFHTTLEHCRIGEGEIFILNREELTNLGLNKQLNFWEKVLSTLNIFHLNVEEEKGVNFFWRTRSPGPHELSYEEIRRLSFYNPSSYRRKAQVANLKNFAFLKILDEVNSSVKNNNLGIDVEMQPGGSVSLDFGYFE